MSASIAKNIVYYWWDIYPLLQGIHKSNYRETSFYWWNPLLFLKTGGEIKMIGTQIDVIRKRKIFKNITINKENYGDF